MEARSAASATVCSGYTYCAGSTGLHANAQYLLELVAIAQGHGEVLRCVKDQQINIEKKKKTKDVAGADLGGLEGLTPPPPPSPLGLPSKNVMCIEKCYHCVQT